MLHKTLLCRAITACMLIFCLAAGLLPAAVPARGAPPAQYFAIPEPTSLNPACTQNDPCALQAAVDRAAAGDTIYASGGTYTAPGAQVLSLNKGVILRGGWDGQAGLMPIINPHAYPTILDGQDARQVVLVGADASPTLIGLDIRNGRAANGAGIYNNSPTGGSVTVIESSIHNNTATSFGGAVYVQHGAFSITDSTLRDNSATYGGGAIMASQGTTITIDRVIASGNSASYGMFIHSDVGRLTLYENRITGHLSSDAHSYLISINSNGTTSVLMENNIFAGNQGDILRQMGNNQTLQVTIRHNTFASNAYKGFTLLSTAAGSITNNIFTGAGDASIDLPDGTAVTIDYNLFWGNGSDPDPGSHAILQDPLLTADYHLGHASPAVDAALDAGTAWDIERDPRPMGSLPDIGADERRLYDYLPLAQK